MDSHIECRIRTYPACHQAPVSCSSHAELSRRRRHVLDSTFDDKRPASLPKVWDEPRHRKMGMRRANHDDMLGHLIFPEMLRGLWSYKSRVWWSVLPVTMDGQTRLHSSTRRGKKGKRQDRLVDSTSHRLPAVIAVGDTSPPNCPLCPNWTYRYRGRRTESLTLSVSLAEIQLYYPTPGSGEHDKGIMEQRKFSQRREHCKKENNQRRSHQTISSLKSCPLLKVPNESSAVVQEASSFTLNAMPQDVRHSFSTLSSSTIHLF